MCLGLADMAKAYGLPPVAGSPLSLAGLGSALRFLLRQLGLGADGGVPGLLDAEDRQEETAEGELAAQDERGRGRDHESQGVLVVEVAELVRLPVEDREDQADQAGVADDHADDQAALQGKLAEQPLYAWLLG